MKNQCLWMLTALTGSVLALAAAEVPKTASCPAISPLEKRMLASITAPNLQADLSFLASDPLAGRFSPSPGLDVAAEFIASRFRGAGLEPGSDSGYFQNAVIENNEAKPPAASNAHTEAIVRNIVGVLPGSDPILKNSYILVTAHYDHLGTTRTAGREAADHPAPDSPDQIYNGANDDGSGTVSVIAIAETLAKMRARPKRSFLFVLFFGEERGLLGSRYYAQHPTVPITSIVADVNLEQIGRTDSTEGPERNRYSLTGMGYSSVPKTMECAATQFGINIYLDSGNDDYFTRSDNASFAERGIPAHTICVAFDFADYHRVSDEWRKIDYQNMARVDRSIAAGLLDLADSPKRPEWNASNPKTARFRGSHRST